MQPIQNTDTKFFDLLVHKYLRKPYKLHYYDHGGKGPVVIFLHGLASSSANWDHLIPLLTDSYRCISIDLTGFGKSPKPTWYEYTPDQHIRNIHATIRSMRIKKPFILVGHSLGALLSARYAYENPKDISRLVLLSPPVYGALDAIDKRTARQRTSLYLSAYKFIRTHHRITPSNLERLAKILPPINFLDLNTTTWIPFTRSLEKCIENQTFTQDIKQVGCPVDIYYGIFDQVIVPYNLQQLSKIKGMTLHPLNVDHVVGKRFSTHVAKLLLSTR